MCSEVTALDTVTVVIQFQFFFRLAKNVAVLLYRLVFGPASKLPLLKTQCMPTNTRCNNAETAVEIFSRGRCSKTYAYVESSSDHSF